MKIGIDIQALQTTGSKNRGIGRYTEQLFLNILQLDKKNQFTFFDNSYYSGKINLPKNDNVHFKTIKYVNEKSVGFNNLRINELSQFFQLCISKQDIIHIASPFEGWINTDTVSRYLPRLNSALVVTLYDLIPLLYPDVYLTHDVVKRYYFTRLDLIKQCDLIFSISESTRNDAINLLGIEPTKIVNIGAAASEHFHKISLTENDKRKMMNKYSIPEHFILYTGGIDFRKNIERTIESFSKLDQSLLKKFSFVIVCKIEPIQKDTLLHLANQLGIKDKLIITGFIPDEDLNVLYNMCRLFIFPSLYEGSGLPILEAMKCGAPVISSNTSSMIELLQKDEYMFNPLDSDEITDLITKSLTNDKFYDELKIHCNNMGTKYSWKQSAQIVLNEYAKLEHIIQEKKMLNKNLGLKPSLAYFSPVPPLESGIAEYSKRLLPYLQKYFDIDLFIGDYKPSPDLNYVINCKHVENFEKCNEIENYDHVLYHMGNSDHHFYMMDVLQKKKGILVLHDMYLGPMQYLFAQKKDIKENSTKNMENFLNDIAKFHGELGKKYVSEFKENISVDNVNKIFDAFPTVKNLIENSSGVIVHSNWSKNKLKEIYDFDNVSIVDFNSYPLQVSDNIKTREELGFSKGDFLIGTFGIVGSSKHLDLVLKNLKKFLTSSKNSKFLIVGHMDDMWTQKISQVIKELNLQDKVVIVGFVDFELYKKYLSIVDISINLRYPTRGETSSTVFDLLRLGIPTIVSNIGPMSELPNDCVIKINEGDENTLEKIVNDLKNNPNLRTNLSQNAILFSSAGKLDSCALQYANAIKLFEKENEISDNLEDLLVKFVSRELSHSVVSGMDDTALDFLSGLMYDLLNNENVVYK